MRGECEKWMLGQGCVTCWVAYTAFCNHMLPFAEVYFVHCTYFVGVVNYQLNEKCEIIFPFSLALRKQKSCRLRALSRNTITYIPMTIHSTASPLAHH
jgi:hypothetical protein